MPLQIKHSIKSYIKHLERERENAFDGKNPSCKDCDENGAVIKEILGRKIKVECDCVNDSKTEIDKKIYEMKKLLEKYHGIFGMLDDELNLESYESIYKNHILMAVIKNYLSSGMPVSLLLSGESGTGKTTILKMIWQILILNNKSVHYFNCARFENINHNVYMMKNASDEIRRMIETAKHADIILLDDHLCQISKNSLAGYYEIFDYARANKKTVIMASNKNYESIIEAYVSKDATMAARIASRLCNLPIIECPISKNGVLVA